MFSSEAVSLSPALVVENDTAMQERLRYILSTLGCDEPQITWTGDGEAAMQLLDRPSFGVVLVDIGLPGDSGIELIEWLQAHHPQVPAVAISSSRSEESIFSALRAGAVAYLLKERDDLELSIGLRSIEQGGATVDPAIARRVLAWHAGHAADSGTVSDAALTPQERKTLELVVQGLGHRDIAEALAMPRLAVECRIKGIYRKLALGSRGEASHMAGGHELLR
ncbi:two component transcriptional regulator, LuxR family [Variovorax paradoxus B4]|uniref:Two component transcriptional regulator, LuxR family n=1 Tax=Variovorax paradoxus B4 TaxID=1246301 RepID=T1XFA9_VARPD|nr:response regulator transcription factor [Variovorax paradoxus]AGU50800.1 two component transcriptional regulator, LuxR family [Variovorax paradoxus B4]